LTNNHQLYRLDGEETQEDETIDRNLVAENSDVDEAEPGDFILINFDGYYNQDENDTTLIDSLTIIDSPPSKIKPFIQARNWLITFGNGDVLPGIEMALRFLKLNQCGVVKCHSKYAYGPYGRISQNGVPEVPPNANVVFKVKIQSILPQHDIKAKTNSFRIMQFKAMKNIGNHYYKNDWIGPDGGNGKIRALKLYNSISKDGLEMLQDLEHGSIDRREVYFLIVDSLNNITALHLREKEYRKANDVATKAIQLDPYNMKALCRAAKALLMIGEFEECKAVLDAADETAENIDTEEGFNKTHVKRLKRELALKKKEHKKLEKEIYAQMLSGKKDDNVKDSSKKTALDQQVLKKSKHKVESNCTKAQETPSGNLTVYIVPILAIIVWILQQILFK
jgi:tetratricopeptide (TPR) repeat protein